MALIEGLEAKPYIPRTSTPAPYGVPTWDDEPDVFDFGSLMQDYQPASFTEPNNVSVLGEGLSLPGLSLPGMENWLQAFQKAPEYVPSNAAGLFAQSQAARPRGGGGGGGSFGLGAYGFTGNSGGKGTRGSSPFGFQDVMWKALGAMNAAMKAAGLGTFGITDGWRSYEQQVALKKRKPGLAATPGRSIHGIGLAGDLRLSKAQAQWVQQNAAKFGLTVPMPGKEPWHIQYSPSLWKGFS